MPELFLVWTHLDFGTRISPKQLFPFLLSRSQSEAWKMPVTSFDFVPYSGFLMDQKYEKVLLFWTCLDLQIST